MERDPVCGMTVDPARAKSRVEFANDTYVFCSESCAKKFSAEPSKVLEFGAKAVRSNVRYACHSIWGP